MGISGASIPSKSQDVVFRSIDEESVFVPIRQSADALQLIYTTNAVGTRVWELVDGARSVEDIAAAVQSEYDVAPETSLADAEDFLAQLTAAGCVAWADGPAG
jgi:hypothetical protein